MGLISNVATDKYRHKYIEFLSLKSRQTRNAVLTVDNSA